MYSITLTISEYQTKLTHLIFFIEIIFFLLYLKMEYIHTYCTTIYYILNYKRKFQLNKKYQYS